MGCINRCQPIGVNRDDQDSLKVGTLRAVEVLSCLGGITGRAVINLRWFAASIDCSTGGGMNARENL